MRPTQRLYYLTTLWCFASLSVLLRLGSHSDNNKSVGNDAKAAARQSPNCIRKTKYVLRNAGICATADILRKTAFSRKVSLKSDDRLLSYSQKMIFNMAAVLHLEF